MTKSEAYFEQGTKSALDETKPGLWLTTEGSETIHLADFANGYLKGMIESAHTRAQFAERFLYSSKVTDSSEQISKLYTYAEQQIARHAPQCTLSDERSIWTKKGGIYASMFQIEDPDRNVIEVMFLSRDENELSGFDYIRDGELLPHRSGTYATNVTTKANPRGTPSIQGLASNLVAGQIQSFLKSLSVHL